MGYAAIKGGRHGIAVHRAALFHVLFQAVRAEGIAVETGLDVESLKPEATWSGWSAPMGARPGRSIWR